jgi:hypothetical protein
VVLVPDILITLVDSNPDKTFATANNRPQNDTNDSYIGFDQGTGSALDTGISFGAPKSISNYIANAGDGKSWKERLTQNQKLFAVSVFIERGNTLTVGSGTPISGIRIYKTDRLPPTAVAAQSCRDVTAAADGLTASDQVNGVTPPQPLTDLSLNAYPSGASTITLHFCNPSTSAVNTPTGSYSFLAVR